MDKKAIVRTPVVKKDPYAVLIDKMTNSVEELPAKEALYIALNLIKHIGFEACLGDAMVLAFMSLQSELERSGQFKRKEVQDFFSKLVLLVDARRKQNPMHKM